MNLENSNGQFNIGILILKVVRALECLIPVLPGESVTVRAIERCFAVFWGCVLVHRGDLLLS